jgi:hypothetical protein
MVLRSPKALVCLLLVGLLHGALATNQHNDKYHKEGAVLQGITRLIRPRKYRRHA